MAPRVSPGRFAALLQEHRVAAGFSQEELAERAGLSRRGISDLERGERRSPHPATVRRLASALGLGLTKQAALMASAHATTTAITGVVRATPPLPVPLTSFIGREPELAGVHQQLRTTRLLTLTGPGGVGKTRLALEFAGKLVQESQRFADGIWVVELAPLDDGAQVPRAVASTLGVMEVPGEPLLETVASWMHGRDLLLILDNCEHLVAACASTAEALLRAGSGVTILATSREALNVAGEVVWPVGPLAADSDGPQLFAARAGAASPTFEITSHNRSTVVAYLSAVGRSSVGHRAGRSARERSYG